MGSFIIIAAASLFLMWLQQKAPLLFLILWGGFVLILTLLLWRVGGFGLIGSMTITMLKAIFDLVAILLSTALFGLQ